MSARTTNRALGVLFVVLTALFSLIALAALDEREWIVVFAAASIAVWLAGMALRSLRRR